MHRILRLCAAAPLLLAAAPWHPPDPANTLVIQTTRGRIVVDMRPDLAPRAVERIILLSREHVYDGLLFHRVIDHFVDQTGNPNNHDGGASSHPNLAPEFFATLPASAIANLVSKSADGISFFVGALPVVAAPVPGKPGQFRAWGAYCPGVAGMGRQADPGSANSEIFFMRDASRRLDHDYTVWGQVVQGLNVVRAINVGEPPAHPDKMITVRLMADLPPAEQPRLELMNTESPEFASIIAAARAQRGADFSLCDITVPVRATP